MRSPRVKICCIGSLEEAQMAIAAGASALGLVSEMPSGPGVIEESVITSIVQSIPPGVATFLLTSKRNSAEIIAQQRRMRTNTLQLVDSVPRDTYAALREALPGIGIVQVIHVLGKESLEEAVHVAPHVDALLLDSGNPSLTVKELGGTGRVHDWSVSRRIRERSEKPVFLAGGLTPGNVREAVDIVQPFGVDLCSGVRTNGLLDKAKLDAFFAALG